MSSPIKELTQEQIDQFHRDGYLVIRDFVPQETIGELKQRMAEIVEKEFRPEELESLSVFSTTENAKKNKHNDDDYFMDSSDKIRFFVERDAVKDRKLIYPKIQSLNKVAHALHDKDPVYRKFSYQRPILRIMEQLIGVERPEDARIVQSMYIFKAPKIGGEVTPHTDSTFLLVDNGSLLGFWFALDDATTENGCLWGWPGSHLRDVPVKLLRKEGGKSTETEMVYSVDKDNTDYDFWNDEKHAHKYVPLDVPRGGLVLLHGQFVHKSSDNRSDKTRHAYTFHSCTLPTKTTWSNLNWLQRDDGFPQYWQLEGQDQK